MQRLEVVVVGVLPRVCRARLREVGDGGPEGRVDEGLLEQGKGGGERVGGRAGGEGESFGKGGEGGRWWGCGGRVEKGEGVGGEGGHVEVGGGRLAHFVRNARGGGGRGGERSGGCSSRSQ